LSINDPQLFDAVPIRFSSHTDTFLGCVVCQQRIT